MGFSVSGSAAIIFIAAFVSFGLLYSAAYNSYERIDAAEDDRVERILDRQNTELQIVDVETNDSNFVNVTVDNTGATTLHVTDTDILMNGTYQEPTETTVDGRTDAELWHPGETLRLNVSYPSDGTVRVKVVSETGVAVFERVEGAT